MPSPLRYEVLATAPSGARAGLLHTRRGVTPTPTFMPVATHAHVRGLSMDEVAASGASICLANTYHLLLRPGVEVFEQVGGIHRFMRWDGGVLTDSGGFQIFSLPGFRQLSEAGARFKSPFDNHPHLLSPETSIATQQAIDSDIMMVLDVCPPSTSPRPEILEAMERTHRWALRSLAARDAKDTGQALFAIVQGGVEPKLRTESAGTLTQHPFDGFAIGGLAVGEARELLYSVTAHTAPLLPKDKPRYLMGVGTPIDLVECVNAGVDMFDCIIPSKMAQQGYAYTFEGQLRVARTEYRLSDAPLDVTCGCPVCRQYTRGYLRHLAHGGHQLTMRLLGIHNLWHYEALMRRMREAILAGRWEEELKSLRERLTPQSARPRALGVKQGDFELVTLKTGARAVRHLGHGEVMHPVGPWEEANRLYVDQLGLERKLAERGDEPVRILDVGLGAGTNAVAALTRAQAMGEKRLRDLEIVSLEVDDTPLQLALGDCLGFPFLAPWRTAAEALLHAGHWEAPSLSWRLLKGDAAAMIDEVDGYFDLVFFDPFSPEANPTMWTPKVLRTIRSRMRLQGALLATYSAATPTRVAFLLAGYFVGKGVSTGTRQETTVAASDLELLAEPLGERFLQRWSRSSAKAPHGLALTDELEAELRAHAQWNQGRGAGT
ncbi:MAG: tRNA guanosine(34) transglycosylase Tgt [Myxococcales bacterium]|nr:tRNA guanosine(34) transglycosylase Tgt [Myxococcales bacterium]